MTTTGRIENTGDTRKISVEEVQVWKQYAPDYLIQETSEHMTMWASVHNYLNR